MIGATGLLFSARRRCISTPTPSKTPRRIPHMTPAPNAVLGPPRIARLEPVKKPAIIAFQGSSFWRTLFTVQSKVVKSPPHTPKLPPSTGARALIADTEPSQRSPRGELRAPLIPCQMVPPMQPMEKAPPKSLRITHGQGSRVWSWPGWPDCVIGILVSSPSREDAEVLITRDYVEILHCSSARSLVSNHSRG